MREYDLLDAARALGRCSSPTFRGLPVSVSAAATSLAKLKEPHTDDMRAMADDILARCPPDREPAAFVIGGRLVAHPALWERILSVTAPA